MLFQKKVDLSTLPFSTREIIEDLKRCYGVEKFFTKSQQLPFKKIKRMGPVLGTVITSEDTICITQFDDGEPHTLHLLAAYNKEKQLTYFYREEGTISEHKQCISRVKCGRVIESIHYPYIYRTSDFFEYVEDDAL